MERDFNTPTDKTPETKWDFFEDLDDEEDKKDNDKPRKKWFSDEEEPDIKDKKPNKKVEIEKDTEKEPVKDRAKKSIAETEEFAKMTPEQKKTALAKEYVENRSEELEEELENVPEGSPEAVEISADLELIQALSDKLENPDIIADDAVEEAYQQIMDRLDEIFNETEDDEELLPALEEVPDEAEASKDETPSIFARPRSKTKAKKTGPDKHTTDSGGLSAKPKTENQPSPVPRSNGPKLKEVVPTSPFLARQRRTGNLAVSEAMNQMLSRKPDQTPGEIKESEIPMKPKLPETETPSITSQPERFVNPIKRSVEEKERRVRQFATKQTLGENISASIFDSSTPSATPEFQPPVPIESLRPVSYQERPTTTPAPERRVTPEQSRDLAQSSTEQLLQIADKIRVDGTTLRALYADNKIDRGGLTKVIKEALKGGDVKTALSKATLGAEAQRGRKIEMRHDDQTFDDVKGYHQTTEAAKARTDRILESLDMVNQAKNNPTKSSQTEPETDTTIHAMQKAQAASKKAKLAFVAVIALAVTTIITALLLAF
ncbi:hypothetical protein H6800_02230 [Candidatus Nomurabacteria bacterium]|nr:hypothetical protein [Candidatus Nomurabacteria bacterium]